VGAVGRAKGVVDVHVAELGEAGAEGGNLVLVGLDLVALGVLALALLLNVEAEVLQQNDGALGVERWGVRWGQDLWTRLSTRRIARRRSPV
jgi:hypothetical protein